MIKKLFGSALLMLSALLCAGMMTLESGNYKFVFSSGVYRWTMSGIWFKGKPVAGKTGYYGNVFSPYNGKYIGAGHTEGGLEKLISATVNVDGKEVPVAKGAVYSGKKIVYTRVSMLDKLKMRAVYTLTADGMEIAKQFEATAKQPVYQMYLYQFCMGSDSTRFQVYRKDGTVLDGNFVCNEKFPVYGEPRGVAFSQFFPKQQTGVINAFGNFGVATGRNLLWDRKGYHKYYFWMDLPPVLEKNWKSPEVKMVVCAFDAADETAWRSRGAAVVKELIKKYPFKALPDKLEPLGKNKLVLPPSDKFQVRKVGLALDKSSTYSIRLRVCKQPGMSAKSSDSFMLVGYYDNARKFHVITTLAGAIKGDGKSYSVGARFKTPDTYQDIYLYIYNSRSTGTVTVSDLVVEKIKK